MGDLVAEIFGGQDQPNTGQRARRRGVNPRQARVGVRRAHHRGVRRAGAAEVSREARGARQVRPVFFAPDRRPDPRGTVHRSRLIG